MTTFNRTKNSNKPQQAPVVNYAIPEVIEAITPLFLATIGAVIGVVVILIQPAETTDEITKMDEIRKMDEIEKIDDIRVTAGLSLAGTAIAGAAGLARTGRRKPNFSVKQEDGNLEVDTPADR